MNQFQEISAQLLSVVYGIWRNKTWVLTVAWTVCLSGWTYVMILPDQYRAEAQVFVDTNSMLEPLLGGLTIETNVADQMRLMTQTLLSRPNLEKLLGATDLKQNVQSALEKEKVLASLRRNISIIRSPRNNIYHISYESSESDSARGVVQSLLDIFVADALTDQKQDVKSVQEFLDEQIQEYEQRLLAAEDKLKEFKRANVGLMPSERTDYYSRLQEAKSQLENAQFELNIAVKRKAGLERELKGEEPTFGIAADSSVHSISTPYDERIEALQAKLDELLLNYTEEHPDVVALRQTIVKVKEERSNFLVSNRQPGSKSLPVNTNPVYQRMRIAHGEAVAEVNAIREKISEYASRVKELQKLVDIVPQVEAQLTRLNRDYEINKSHYETLIQRRETARMSEQVGKSAEKVKIRVVEPPHVSPRPTGPNRILLLSIVLVIGLGAGVGLGAAIALARPVIDSVQLLRSVAGYPVLGSVALMPGVQGGIGGRTRIARFALPSVALLGLYGVLLVLINLNINLANQF